MKKRAWILRGPLAPIFGWQDDAGVHHRPATPDEWLLGAETKHYRHWLARLAICASTLYEAQQFARRALEGEEDRNEDGEQLVREISPQHFPPEPVGDEITRRAAFEAWAVRNGLSVERLRSGRYAASETYWAFEGWCGRVVAVRQVASPDVYSGVNAAVV